MRLLLSCFLVSVMSLTTLPGCASRAKGNYINETSEAINSFLARDSVAMLQAIYPPAQTTINFNKGIKETDYYGLTLIEQLQYAGYAVSDLQSSNPKDSMILNYVVDYVENPFNDDGDSVASPVIMTRVVLYIGNDTLTRAYQRSGITIAPISNWTHGRWEKG